MKLLFDLAFGHTRSALGCRGIALRREVNKFVAVVNFSQVELWSVIFLTVSTDRARGWAAKRQIGIS